MANQPRQTETRQEKLRRPVARGALLAALALLPTSVYAQNHGPARLDPPPSAKVTSSPAAPNVIDLSTSKEQLNSLLGEPIFRSTICCLCRAMYTYADGTKIILVNGRVVSVMPGGLAVGSPALGFTIERQGRQVFVEPVVLCGVDIGGHMGDVKRQVEESFLFAPPAHEVTGMPTFMLHLPAADGNISGTVHFAPKY